MYRLQRFCKNKLVVTNVLLQWNSFEIGWPRKDFPFEKFFKSFYVTTKNPYYVDFILFSQTEKNTNVEP